LNDGVKGFVSAHEDMRQFSDLGAVDEGGVRIYTPSARYLFAMKCMAMRVGEGAHDRDDIEFPAQEIGIQETDTALDIIAAFYPTARISTKVAFDVQETMEKMAERYVKKSLGAGNQRKISDRPSCEVAQNKLGRGFSPLSSCYDRNPRRIGRGFKPELVLQ
jgi:hypothetical protein